MTFSQVPLNEAFWFQEGPGVRNWQFTTSGIKLLNVANIVKDGSIDLSKTDRHLSEEEVEKKYSHFLVDSGDLVIASSGITIDSDGFLTLDYQDGANGRTEVIVSADDGNGNIVYDTLIP